MLIAAGGSGTGTSIQATTDTSNTRAVRTFGANAFVLMGGSSTAIRNGIFKFTGLPTSAATSTRIIDTEINSGTCDFALNSIETLA